MADIYLAHTMVRRFNEGKKITLHVYGNKHVIRKAWRGNTVYSNGTVWVETNSGALYEFDGQDALVMEIV